MEMKTIQDIVNKVEKLRIELADIKNILAIVGRLEEKDKDVEVVRQFIEKKYKEKEDELNRYLALKIVV